MKRSLLLLYLIIVATVSCQKWYMETPWDSGPNNEHGKTEESSSPVDTLGRVVYYSTEPGGSQYIIGESGMILMEWDYSGYDIVINKLEFPVVLSLSFSDPHGYKATYELAPNESVSLLRGLCAKGESFLNSNAFSIDFGQHGILSSTEGDWCQFFVATYTEDYYCEYYDLELLGTPSALCHDLFDRTYNINEDLMGFLTAK